jgi:hypothetical protein
LTSKAPWKMLDYLKLGSARNARAGPVGLPKTGGRKKGVGNKATAERKREIAQSGLTPLEYLLSVLRDETVEPRVRMQAAVVAAPYVHPLLANIDVANAGGKPFQVVMSASDIEML